MRPENFPMSLSTFFLGNAVPKEEAEVITLICSHHIKHGESTLMNAIRKLQVLLKEYQPAADGSELL
jgi:hypothetical protein